MKCLARAARRLSQAGGTRGLSDALADASAASRQTQSVQQLWALSALRAHAGGSSGSGTLSPSAVPSPALEQASASGGSSSSSSSSSSAAAAATAAVSEAVAAAARVRPPPGHTDFQQRQLLMVFTCSKCNTRAAKAFSKQSYEQGVVIVECPGCQNRHLIADNLGWFGQKGTVEQFAAERGGTVMKRTADGTLELTPEDLMGASLVQEAAEAAEAAAAGEGGSGCGGGSSGGDVAAAVTASGAS